jgi:hypothetical protein
MRHVQWTLWPGAAPISVEAVLLQSRLVTYLTCTTREAHRSRSWLEFLARKE